MICKKIYEKSKYDHLKNGNSEQTWEAYTFYRNQSAYNFKRMRSDWGYECQLRFWTKELFEYQLNASRDRKFFFFTDHWLEKSMSTSCTHFQVKGDCCHISQLLSNCLITNRKSSIYALEYLKHTAKQVNNKQ